MKQNKFICMAVAAILLFSLTSCSDTTVSNKEGTNIEPFTTNVSGDSDVRDNSTTTAIVGSWQDESGYGYFLNISIPEDSYEYNFDISYMPHGGVYLDWNFTQGTSFQDNKFNYENGTMTYTELLPDENGNLMMTSEAEEGISGSVSFDADLDILYWFNGPGSEELPIIFQRKIDTEKYRDFLINDISYEVALANGWEKSWIIIADNIAEDDSIYFKEAEEDPSLYGTGNNAWDDISINGITYEMAIKHGWEDAWMDAVNHMGTDDGDYDGDYENFTPENTQMSDDDLRQINFNSAWKVVDNWKYNYNKGKDQHSQINNASLRLPLASIKRGSTTATITTQVEYWFFGQGGGPAGSVYTVLTVDLNTGTILSSEIIKAP